MSLELPLLPAPLLVNTGKDSTCRTQREERRKGREERYTESARLSIQSFRIGSTCPSPASECCPSFGSKGGTHSQWGEGGGKPIRTKGETL